MAKLRLVRLEHRKDIKQIKTSYAQDQIINDSLMEYAERIRGEYGLTRYGLSSLIASLALSDPDISEIIERRRSEAGVKTNGKTIYHKDIELN